MILDEKLDDCKSVLDDETRHRLEKFEREFWYGVNNTIRVWRSMAENVHQTHGLDRKSFALSNTAQIMDSNLKSVIFKAWGHRDFNWQQAVINTISKNIGTQTKVDSIRGLFGGAKWSGCNIADK